MTSPFVLPVGPETPEGLRPLLRSLTEAIAALHSPGGPTPLFAMDAASLPAPAGQPNTLVLVTDLQTLAYSDGVHWIRQDTGAVIV